MMSSEKFSPPTIPAYYDLPNAIYHESEGISSSGLKLFDRSPRHYWERYLNPNREPSKKTPALVLGEQIHTAVLEPSRYVESYYPLPQKYDRRLKADKEDYEFHESRARAEGKTVIDFESHITCQAIAEAVHKSDAASFLFEQDGLIEKAFFWIDQATGVLCKAKPDKLLTSVGVHVLDVKSTEDARPDAFSRQIANYDYHISAEFYRRGVQAVLGLDVYSAIFAAFEKEPPYACAFYEADPEMLTYASTEIDRILQRFAECQELGQWPGYPDAIQPISLPKWVKTA
jgi:hypothetical protein